MDLGYIPEFKSIMFLCHQYKHENKSKIKGFLLILRLTGIINV